MPTAARSPRHVWCWVRHASSTQEDAWRERLAFLGSDLVIHGRPGIRLIRLEAYRPSAAPLQALRRTFGGRVNKIDVHRVVARANAPRHPLRLARDFVVMDAHGRWPAAQPKPRILLRIAGVMAFGTGEHATTAACLRFLRAQAGELPPDWTALDIGTGSGILAIAAEKLGAARVEAFDYDTRALPAARANFRRNRCRHITLCRRDLLKWRPSRRYDVVTANVFSEILRAAAPTITATLRPGACLILSGILRTQEKETLTTFLALGLTLEKTARRGKWVTLLLRALPVPGSTAAPGRGQRRPRR